MADSITLYESPGRCIWFTITEQKLEMAVQDLGGSTYLMNGTDTYEFWYSVDGDNAKVIRQELLLECTDGQSIEQKLRDEFGREDGPMRFQRFCESKGIRPKFACY